MFTGYWNRTQGLLAMWYLSTTEPNLPVRNAAFPDVNGALEVHLDQGRLVGAVLVDEGVAEGDAHHQARLDAFKVPDLLVVEV